MTEGGVDGPIRIWNRPQRWLSLQFNTTADLYEHLDAVASWLEEARHAILLPLVEAYDPTSVRWSIDPNDSLQGAPGGLLVTSGGWSIRNRPVFGGGDQSGWNRKLAQLSRGQLREIECKAMAFGLSGHWRDGPGEVHLRAVLRDHFTVSTAAPLPRDHPGRLQVWARTGLLDGVASLDGRGVLEALGQLAIDTVPDGHAFLELERRLAGQQEIVPVSPVAWMSPPGCVEFRPESVLIMEPPGRN